MAKHNYVNLDLLIETFLHIEQKITEINAKNSMLESRLEHANKLLKFYTSREKSLVDERDALLVSVNRLQQSLQEQCHLREENDRLKTDMAELKQQNQRRVESHEAEVKKLLERKDLDLEEMKERLNSQEKERQSELLQLQLEFGAKLARVQSSAQRSQQHHHQEQHSPHSSGLLPLTVFKRKLHYFQEEKTREIAALRERIRELEENQQGCSRLKRRQL